MHQPIPQQGRRVEEHRRTGDFNHHVVPTNGPTLTAFLFHVTNLWRRTLRQRSQKDWTTWERIKRLADDWLPQPRILHPWPERRFAVRHPRWELYARNWICTDLWVGREVTRVLTAKVTRRGVKTALMTQLRHSAASSGGADLRHLR